MFDPVDLICNYAVHWKFVIYFLLLLGSFEANNSRN